MDLIPWLVGGAIVALALFMLATHIRAWKDAQADCAVDATELPWFRKRFRRRMQATGMLLLIGVLIPVGDQFLPRDRPLMWSIYWLLILLTLLWIVMLAVGDFASTAVHSKVASSRVQKKQLELQAEFERLSALRDQQQEARESRRNAEQP